VGVGTMAVTYLSFKHQIYSRTERHNDAINAIRKDLGISTQEKLVILEPSTSFGSEIYDKFVTTWNEGLMKLYKYAVDQCIKPSDP